MKKNILFIFLFAVSVTLSSCGFSGEETMDVDEASCIVITLQPYYRLDANMKLLINEYEMSHENIHFEILPDIEWGQMDVAMAKVYSDISSGSGPDIIMMTNGELYNFAAEGCLCELTNILSDINKGALLKNVLEYGKVNEAIYLLPMNVNVTSMIMNKKYCPSGSLTISETLDIIEAREEEGNSFEYLFVSNKGLESTFDIFMSCIDESDFIDWDRGTCSFDSELFIRVLNTCKEYDDYTTNAIDINDVLSFEYLKDDKILGQYQNTYSVFSYSSMRTILGYDYIDTGLPSDARNGKKMTFASGITVNKNTKHIEVIADFLNYVYSYDARVKLNSDELRTDIYDGRIEKDNSTGLYGIRTNDDELTLLSVKQDGTLYIDEYFDFLNTFSLPNTYVEPDIIKDIIYEESAPFFANEKSADEVVKVIQARISLYLEELK